jgi:hypothetical protein
LGHESKQWRRESRRQLREHPVCARCPVRAAVAHHAWGDGPLGGGPLESLCAGCHRRLHAAEERASRGVKPT